MATQRDYDRVIEEHYESVAKRTGDSSSSTMADKTIRERETNAIVSFLKLIQQKEGRPLRVGDVGCGNGYTLQVLREELPENQYVGIELTDGLRKIAEQRFEGDDQVSVRKGDVRDPAFAGDEPFDVLISQRVLINLLNDADQKEALSNYVGAIRPGGYLFVIEAFREPLETLNEAREELQLDPIDPAHHNLYLERDFFEGAAELQPFEDEAWEVQANDLSTHYFVSRAFFPWVTKGQPLKRNSQFMLFFTNALKPGIGDFSPLQILPFRKAVTG